MATSIIENDGNVFVAGNISQPNINRICLSGTYVYDASTVGRPSNYGMVLHMGTAREPIGWHWQLAFSTENKVYVRSNINSTPSNFDTNWDNWKEL